MAMCRNSVLASQIKKVLPNTISFEKRNCLHNALQEISQESLLQGSVKQQITFEIPRKSHQNSEVVMEEYVVTGKEEKLLTDSFVQNLPISIAEKRLYRKSIFVSLKRRPWYTKLYNSLLKKWENFLSYFDLWHGSLNIIEGQHGAAITSYFVFIRWLLYMNIIMFFLNFIFLVIPQIVTPGRNTISVNHTILYSTHVSSNMNSNLREGPLEPTYLFTGFYPPFNIQHHGYIYNMSIAFLCILLATFIVCFCMMVQYSSIGVQEAFTIHSKKSYLYANEVFSAWEYCIKEPESADRLHYQLVFTLKTALDEDRSSKKITERSTRMWFKLYSIRFVINIFLLTWLIICCYLIYFVAVYQMREQQEYALSEPGFRTFFLQFLPSLTLIILNSISPIMFKALVTFEKYSARVENNLSIFRNLVLDLSSIIILLNTFYNQVACKAKDICGAGLDATCRSPRCWETYIGQQLYKLILTKMFVLIAVFLLSDVLKYYITQKYDNKFTNLMGAPAFSLPSEVLAVINSQTILWLGVFYSPLLPAVMILKLILMFHLKKIKVLKLCAPQESSYRASKINSVFIFIMLISFFVVLVVQSFAIDSISPSRGCGPFQYFKRMTETVPVNIRSWLSLLMSYWVFMFIVFILCIAVYYYCRIIASQKELLKRLKAHLVLQSHDKQFLLRSIAELKNKKQK